MKKSELLAPAGDLNSLYSAISNGATSVYFGGSSFNARMYANNFTDEDIIKAIEYAHKRNVKVFVTLNILIKDEEINEVKEYIKKLYLFNIDGLIIQDYGVLNFILENYNDLIISCSTQTTIDDLEGALYFQEKGVNRVVLARECSLETIKKIKENTNIEIEAFAHGALCVCYSGQCLLSNYIGGRSGNRGKCAQPCRKTYTLINKTQNIKLNKTPEYLLSLKDLKTLDNLNELLKTNIDSLKIEGRMKNPEYVANVTSSYKNYLESYYNNKEINLNLLNENLEKTFSRTFTKGYIFKENIKDMNANKRVSNVGTLIGKVTNSNYKGYIEITLNNELSQNDIIRFNLENEVTSKLTKLFDSNLKLTNKCNKKAYIKIQERIPLNTLVFKTFDYNYDLELKKSYPKDNYKNPIDIKIKALINYPLELTLTYLNYKINVKSNIVEKASSYPLTKEKIYNQINKLNDTPYYINNFDIEMDDNIYINIKELNELRRNDLTKLESKLLLNDRKEKDIKELKNINTSKEELKLTFKVHTLEQFNYLKSLGYEDIYFIHNSTEKVNNSYNLDSDLVLIKNYGSIYKYKNKELIIDYSLNVFNHLSMYYLYKEGAKRITPSLELSTLEYINLYKNYEKEFNYSPSLEFIAYTRQELMISKFCPLNCLGQCGKCHLNEYELKDDYTSFPIYTDKKCQMHLLADKVTNKIKDIPKIKEYSSAIRLEFFNETPEEIKKIIDEVNHQLSI